MLPKVARLGPLTALCLALSPQALALSQNEGDGSRSPAVEAAEEPELDDDADNNRPQAPFSAEACVTATRRTDDDIILGDPNGRGRNQSRGLHITLGETLCITGGIGEKGAFEDLAILRGEHDTRPVIALRLGWNTKGTLLQIATTSDQSLRYQAFIPVERSRLVVPTATLPVEPNGPAYEAWPTEPDELWLTDLRFVPARQRRKQPQSRPRPRQHERGPADRRWGMDFAIPAQLAQADFTDLNRALAADGLGQIGKTQPMLGFLIGGFWRQLRFGLVFGRTGYRIVDSASHPQVQAQWFRIGPYIGLDLLRWQALTAYAQLECHAGEISIKRTEAFPSFAATNKTSNEVARETHTLDFSLGNDVHIPFYNASRDQVSLVLGTRIGYGWQFAQGKRWAYRDDENKSPGSTPAKGPSLDSSGWRLDLHLGCSFYEF